MPQVREKAARWRRKRVALTWRLCSTVENSLMDQFTRFARKNKLPVWTKLFQKRFSLYCAENAKNQCSKIKNVCDSLKTRCLKCHGRGGAKRAPGVTWATARPWYPPSRAAPTARRSWRRSSTASSVSTNQISALAPQDGATETYTPRNFAHR